MDQNLNVLLDQYEREALYSLCLEDVSLFAATFFGEYLLPFEPFHVEVLRFAASVPKGLVLLPCSHGKTELCSKILPIFEICRNQNVEIILVAHTYPDAEMLGAAILRELEQNERLIEAYGPFVPSAKQHYPWGATAFSVMKRTHRGKDATLEIFGTGSSIFGHRADLVIGDDILDIENSSSEIRRSGVQRWFDEGVLKTLDPTKGRIVLVGTVMHYLDLYADIQDRPGWEVLKKQAITYDGEGTPRALWPNRWPLSRLMDEKRQGTIAFERRFQNIVYPEGMLKFRESDIELCKDETRRVGDRGDSWEIIIGIDPAVGKSEYAKYFALTVLGYNPAEPQKRYIIDGVRDKIEVKRQIPLVLSKIRQYSPQLIVVEKNACQSYFVTYLEEKAREEGLYCRIQPHETTKEKHDFVMGIDALVPIVENHAFSFPWRTEESRQLFLPWLTEMMDYPISKTTDCLMSLWFAELYLKKQAKMLKCITKQRKTAWRPGARRKVRNPFYPRAVENGRA